MKIKTASTRITKYLSVLVTSGLVSNHVLKLVFLLFTWTLLQLEKNNPKTHLCLQRVRRTGLFFFVFTIKLWLFVYSSLGYAFFLGGGSTQLSYQESKKARLHSHTNTKTVFHISIFASIPQHARATRCGLVSQICRDRVWEHADT